MTFSKGLIQHVADIYIILSMAVLTLEDKQIVWTDKSSQTNKSSDVKTRRTNRLILGRLERRFFPDNLSVETNQLTTARHKFTSD